MTAIELARKYFPCLPDDALANILWSKTGYPSFFLSDDIETELRRQLADYAEAKKKYPGQILCDFCNIPAVITGDKNLCVEHKTCFEM